MAILSKAGLSAAPAGNGPISITGTDAASANTIHTAVAGTGAEDWDEVWLTATNTTSDDRLLTLLIGGTAVGPVRIPAYTAYRVLDGHPLQNGLAVAAYADASGVVVQGYVNQMRAA